MENLRQYSAKVLLFGEYVIIQGSSALALPFKSYHGSFRKESAQYNLADFYHHVGQLNIADMLLNAELLEKDQKEGISYVSNIPVGYGLGSSGALCAAVFDRYFQKQEAVELKALQSIFSEMESFFHGSSSGLDPLVSYLNTPIIIDGNKDIEFIDPPKSKFQFYLIDTGKSRVTSEYVKIYLAKMKNSSYAEKMKELANLNGLAIQSYHQNDDSLIEYFKEISKAQKTHFSEMIPPVIQPIYEKYNLKLCGAGGGGFFLGLCLRSEFEKINSQGLFIPLL